MQFVCQAAHELHSLEDVLRGGRRTFLRLVHFAQQQELDTSPLLFLLLARTYLNECGTTNVTGAESQPPPRKDWLFELHSLFLLPDSPLRVADNFREDSLNRVYDALNSLAANVSLTQEQLLEPFVSEARTQLKTLLGHWNKQFQVCMLTLSSFARGLRA